MKSPEVRGLDLVLVSTAHLHHTQELLEVHLPVTLVVIQGIIQGIILGVTLESTLETTLESTLVTLGSTGIRTVLGAATLATIGDMVPGTGWTMTTTTEGRFCAEMLLSSKILN